MRQGLKELSLIERVVRVEEELKALREFVEKRFEVMDERFAFLAREMDKRFEALQREMDRRFEALERRFQFFQWVVLWRLYSDSWHAWFNFEICGRVMKI